MLPHRHKILKRILDPPAAHTDERRLLLHGCTFLASQVARAFCRQASCGPEPVDFTHPPGIHSIPFLPALRSVLASAKVGKAAGMGSIPSELGRLFADESARALFPLLLKVMWGGTGPAGFKSGQAIVMYRGRGPATSRASYTPFCS